MLPWALRSWRARVEHYGLNFGDGMAPPLDFRFANDLLFFAASKEEFVEGFVLTTEAQPPTSLRLENGAAVSVFTA